MNITKISPELYEKIHYFIPRLLLMGCSWGDIVLSIHNIQHDNSDTFWQEWMLGWKKTAKKYESIAYNAFEISSAQYMSDATIFEALLKASACYHWSEFMCFQDVKQKEALRKKVSVCFGHALPYMNRMNMHFKKLSLSYQNKLLPGYLFSSDFYTKKPCVILINGLDSAKEVELFYFTQQFIKRGFSAFVFDGPGQGELLGEMPMEIHFEKVVEQYIEKLIELNLIDHTKIGLFGVSFGGYLALRSASYLANTIKVCINLSGGFDLDNFDNIDGRIQQDFSYVFQKPEDEMHDIALHSLNLKELPSPKASILSIHGGLDRIFTMESCHRVMNWAENGSELMHYPNENHVCQNYFQEYIPVMCDWMKEKMR